MTHSVAQIYGDLPSKIREDTREVPLLPSERQGAIGQAAMEDASAVQRQSLTELESFDTAGMQQSPGGELGAELGTDLLTCSPEERAERWPAIVRALRNPNYRLFVSGNLLSNIGTWMQNVAQGWLVLTLTNSAFWLGFVGFAGAIPFLFFMLFGGVIADRVDKRRLLLGTQTVMMVLAFILAWLTYIHHIQIWGVALLAFLTGTAMAINNPSYQAMVPKLVPREDLTNAIALNSAQFNMSRILGPTLGGYAMVAFGIAGNFFLNGLSFVAVIWALTRLKFPDEKRDRHQGMFDSLVSGFRYVRSIPEMYVLTCMITVSSFLSIPFLTFIPYFAKNQLHVGERGLGLLLAASGTGAVFGAITVAWISSRGATGSLRYRGRIIAFCGAAVMAVVVVFCYSQSVLLSEICMLLEGYGMILFISAVNVAMQFLSSDAMRGRVMSIYGTAFLGLPPPWRTLSRRTFTPCPRQSRPRGHVRNLLSRLSLLFRFFAGTTQARLSRGVLSPEISISVHPPFAPY